MAARAHRCGSFQSAVLVKRIDGQAAEELGEEVGGLLRHHVAGEGYFPELLHGNWVGEEADVCFASANLLYGFGSVTEVAEVGLLADFFGIEAEKAVEDDGVQVAQVELALALGQVGKSGGGFGFGAQQKSAGAGYGDEGCALLVAEQLDVGGCAFFSECFDGEELFGGGREGYGVETGQAYPDLFG